MHHWFSLSFYKWKSSVFRDFLKLKSDWEQVTGILSYIFLTLSSHRLHEDAGDWKIKEKEKKSVISEL